VCVCEDIVSKLNQQLVRVSMKFSMGVVSILCMILLMCLILVLF